MSREVIFPPIRDVADFLGIEYSEGHNGSLSAVCPFCGRTGGRKTMGIDEKSSMFHCLRCDASGRTLALYAKVRFGIDYNSKSGSFKELYHQFWNEYNGGVEVKPAKPKYQSNKVEISAASDYRTNEVYNALLSFSEFELSEAHKKRLLDRGLSMEAIKRNGYKTVPSHYNWVQKYNVSKELLNRIRAMANAHRGLQTVSDDKLMAMLVVGQFVKSKVGAPDRVPGFFKLGDYWLVKIDSGILIPTRNCRGQIVAMQTRRDYGDIRYLTMSSRGLPGGVTVRISRIHFPLGNAPLNEGVKVLLTEGPLKADVAVELLNRTQTPYALIALHGVNAKRDLKSTLSWLHNQKGVSTITNAYDMDRLLNPHVQKAVQSTMKLCIEQGMKVNSIYWDSDEGKKKANVLYQLLRQHDIPYVCKGDWRIDAPLMARELYQRKIDYCIVNGEKDYWSSKTKGIDDYLRQQQLKGNL